MQKIIRILSVFLYIAAGGVLAIYLFADFNPRIMIPPVSRERRKFCVKAE